MRCKKFRKEYLKYLDGRLSEDEYNPIKQHNDNCPDCAGEVRTMNKMRSLLRASGKVERSDIYWDTYWERLEKRLPAEPLKFTLKSSVSITAKKIFHRPVLFGQITVYILLLVFIIYIVPNRFSREKPLNITSGETTSLDESKLSEPEVTTRAGRELAQGKVNHEIKKSKEPIKNGVTRDKPKIGLGIKPTEAKEKSTVTELAMRAATTPSLEAMHDKVISAAITEDNYSIAEKHFKNGEYLQAIPAYQNFITENSSDPRAVNAQYQIGESYYQLEKYPEAISNFTIVAKEIAPQKEEADDAVAVAKEVAKESDRQFAYVARRSEIGEREAPARKQVVDDREDITKDSEKLISRAIFRQAESYEHLEKREEALIKYREYVQKYPQGEYISQAREKIDKLTK